MLSKLIQWQNGRQNSGYFKRLLLTFNKPFHFDMYLLKFPEGSFIKEHIDPLKEGYKHFRLNIILKKPSSGGIFYTEKSIFEKNRIKFFRPDLYKHSVSKIIKGDRFIISIGFLIKNN